MWSYRHEDSVAVPITLEAMQTGVEIPAQALSACQFTKRKYTENA
jgi:hypothetical protein